MLLFIDSTWPLILSVALVSFDTPSFEFELRSLLELTLTANCFKRFFDEIYISLEPNFKINVQAFLCF